MMGQYKKLKASIGLTIAALMISSTCYAQDDPMMDIRFTTILKLRKALITVMIRKIMNFTK